MIMKQTIAAVQQMALPLTRRTFCRLVTISCTTVSIKSIKTKMNKITEVKFGPLTDSLYLKPFRMAYKQNGKNKFWDIMEMHDSVAIILYNVTRNVFIFVKQFRPGVYYVNIPAELRNKPIDMEKYPAELGITIELCAGIVDKNKPLVEIAKEEVLEECGYDVPIEKFERTHAFNSNIGISGSVLQMYYCEITDAMKVHKGGGIDDEMIDVIEMSLEECERYTSKSFVRSPGSVLIAYYWFRINKPQYCQCLKKEQ